MSPTAVGSRSISPVVEMTDAQTSIALHRLMRVYSADVSDCKYTDKYRRVRFGNATGAGIVLPARGNKASVRENDT